MDGIAICETCPSKNALTCRILQAQSHNFIGDDTPDIREASPVLGPRHQFPLGSPALPLFWFLQNDLCKQGNYHTWGTGSKHMLFWSQTVAAVVSSRRAALTAKCRTRERKTTDKRRNHNGGLAVLGGTRSTGVHERPGNIAPQVVVTRSP